MSTKSNTKYVNYCFTSFLERCPVFNPDKEVYLIFQKEICPETKKKHWQGFVKFKAQTSFRYAQELLGDTTCHLENARDAQASVAYCSKTETRCLEPNCGPFEFGDKSKVVKERQRTDLDLVKVDLDAGMQDSQLSDRHFSAWCRYNRSFSLYRNLKDTPRDFKSFVIILSGPTGIGKTKWFWEQYPDGFALSRGNSGNIWWDGYCGQYAIILDDYYGWLPWDTLLRLLDRYPFTIEYKGGSRQFTSRVICITSNVPYTEWYPSIGIDKFPAFTRRIDHVSICTSSTFTRGLVIPGLPVRPGSQLVGQLPQASRLTTIATREQESPEASDEYESDSESDLEIK